MVLDALSYSQLAGGLGEVIGQRASAAARAVLPYGRLGSRVPGFADDLIAATEANRGLLAGLVSHRRNVARLGRWDELDWLPRELDRPRRRAATRKTAAQPAGTQQTQTIERAAQ
ncbi:hypothetical protein C3Y87_17625 [Carbonactinospora thermoautotrophica]|uniref:hypothetical protein n=1 Tax=Carbonactinospora thermoautotrophica TaxID=1469144 RepID=UPI0022715465|nr:hypothetical protein [Carbonactinospora thermoautotrophica]MCX9193189.1 hypothetical protein [Carbonactinospora thermoautotrophica]